MNEPIRTVDDRSQRTAATVCILTSRVVEYFEGQKVFGGDFEPPTLSGNPKAD